RHAHRASARFAPLRPPRRVPSFRSRRRHERWRSAHRRMPCPRYPPRCRGRLRMKQAWPALRSIFLWGVRWLTFLISVPSPIGVAVFRIPRKHDWIPRAFCRRIAYFSGAKVVAHRGPGFDPQRTCFFMVNHVNLFDPFILYCAIPQLVRGWELESHFKIPVYGWLMKRFGNVPVPDVRRAADLKRMWRLTCDALDAGTSLIIFSEA